MSGPEEKREYVQNWLDKHVNGDRSRQRLEDPHAEPQDGTVRSPPRASVRKVASSPVIGGRRSLKRKLTSLQHHKREKERLSEAADASDISIIANSLMCDVEKITSVKDDTGDFKIQLIESTSSEDKSSRNIEEIVQDNTSDTDKTKSDLIEEISTQFIDSSKKSKLLSQVISNPSSTSSESDPLNDCKIETNSTTPAIDSLTISSPKRDSNKTSYISHEVITYKKSKTKKGSLLDSLQKVMAKEKSNVNILRHQLKTSKDVLDKPFILAQIVEHISSDNNNQILECILVEDSWNLLDNLFKKNIIVLSLPEISGMINEKPLLKIYEPWTTLDPQQFVLYISRFTALTPKSEISIDPECLKLKTDLYNCSCIDEKMLTNHCEENRSDKMHYIIKSICDKA